MAAMDTQYERNRRKKVVRTASILGAIAGAIFMAFILSGVIGR